MITTAAFGNTARTVGKLLFALVLLLIAVAAGFGGTALFVYHQFGDAHHSTRPARSLAADHPPLVQPSQGAGDQGSQVRRVASLPSDESAYTYADNQGGQPTTLGRRARPTSTVPAPLEAASQTSDSPTARVRLDDPESHYIVDAHTGRVIGIDGSAGARREAEEENSPQRSAPPRAVAVQTPPPEVRVASPVLDGGVPVYHRSVVAPMSKVDPQYLPIRKALPVTPAETDPSSQIFNAGEYMMNGQDRPVLRAQAVVPSGTRAMKTVRIYHLPDGSQMVAAE